MLIWHKFADYYTGNKVFNVPATNLIKVGRSAHVIGVARQTFWVGL